MSLGHLGCLAVLPCARCDVPHGCLWLVVAAGCSNGALPAAGTWTWACGPRRCRRWCGAESPRRCGGRCGSCWQGVTTTTTSWRSTGSSSQRYHGFSQLFAPHFWKNGNTAASSVCPPAWGSVSVPECINEWPWFSPLTKTLTESCWWHYTACFL